MHETHRRFTQFAVAAGCRRTRFLVEQHGANDGLHVTAHALTVVVERRRHPRHIGGRRIARNQSLDQLLAKKRADVRMIEQGVECDADVVIGRGQCLCRYGHA